MPFYKKLIYSFLDSNEHDKILADGIMKFLEDLGLSPDSRLVLLLAWKFKSATQCVFTKEEFNNGMTELGYYFSLGNCESCVFIRFSLNTQVWQHWKIATQVASFGSRDSGHSQVQRCLPVHIQLC